MKNRLAIFSAIFAVGLFFRLYNINWDQNFHLHPDERFLTFVGASMKQLSSILDYFNPLKSTFNPANIGYPFFVYGIFPLVINKILALAAGNDTYNLFTLQGRVLSSVFDMIALIYTFRIAYLFEKRYRWSASVKYWAAFLYAIAVFPVQMSHFFTVDTFLNAFMLMSLYYAVRYFSHGGLMRNVSASAFFMGAAISSKITSILLLPLIIVLLIYSKAKKGVAVRAIFIYILAVYASIRLLDPYMFSSASFLDPRISGVFLRNLIVLKSLEDPNGWFPPAIQWINRMSLSYTSFNLALYGVGIFYFLFFTTGVFQVFRKRYGLLQIILLWMGLFFAYQSFQFAKNMRYLLPIYPLIALTAGLGMFSVVKRLSSRLAAFIIVAVSLLWPVAFLSIYAKPQTRIAASAWIYSNVPAGSRIATEHWDDPLPLPVSGGSSLKRFRTVELPVFDPDTDEKWDKMMSILNTADYYVLSSNRGWGSIMRVPEKYPKTSAFYKNLFANKLQFKKVAEFSSYPSLEYLKIPLTIRDENADESFTVYDHPKVMIFKRL